MYLELGDLTKHSHIYLKCFSEFQLVLKSYHIAFFLGCFSIKKKKWLYIH